MIRHQTSGFERVLIFIVLVKLNLSYRKCILKISVRPNFNFKSSEFVKLVETERFTEGLRKFNFI